MMCNMIMHSKTDCEVLGVGGLADAPAQPNRNCKHASGCMVHKTQSPSIELLRCPCSCCCCGGSGECSGWHHLRKGASYHHCGPKLTPFAFIQRSSPLVSPYGTRHAAPAAAAAAPAAPPPPPAAAPLPPGRPPVLALPALLLLPLLVQSLLLLLVRKLRIAAAVVASRSAGVMWGALVAAQMSCSGSGGEG